MKVYVLFDARDYYGPHYHAVHRTLAGAKADAAKVEQGLVWRPCPSRAAGRWETMCASWQIHVDQVEP